MFGQENLYAKAMTEELALFIKETRKGSSWRALATRVSEKYPDLDVEPSNQLEGMELCEAARDFLKETDWE